MDGFASKIRPRAKNLRRYVVTGGGAWYNSVMKITVITAGGTIACENTGGVLRPTAGTDALLAAALGEGAPEADYVVRPVMNKLSENMTGADIADIAGEVRSALSRSDGVVVTHGTDTLAFTAAALSYALGLCDKPVAIASANVPPREAGSDAPLCFAACAAVAASGMKGVFACNVRGSAAYVHRASRLLPCLPYSGERYSLGGEYAVFSGGRLVRNASCRELPDGLPAADLSPLRLPSDVMLVCPFSLSAYPTVPEGVRAVVFSAFHSGTLPTGDRTFAAFCRACRERGISLYAACSSPDVRYESALLLPSLGVTVLPRLAPAAALVKLRLRLPPELSLGGDVV